MNPLSNRSVNWRWLAAGLAFLCGFIGFLGGATVSERPYVETATAFTKAYYALGLFVVGGLDIGTPNGGPLWAQTILWIAYFGAPMLTATAVIETIAHVVAPGRWQLRNITDHTIVFGASSLANGYLRLLREHSDKTRVVVVDNHFDPVHAEELRQMFGATVLVGDLTHEYLLRQLRLKRCKRVVLLGENDFQSFEAATKILRLAPWLADRIILRCHNLRFMRAVQQTELAGNIEIFNTYHLAATGFVHKDLLHQFHSTVSRDVVVMAGFGRFGQSVLEELQAHAHEEIAQVVVIDKDADRRVLVVDEQRRMLPDVQRTVLEGDISHPGVWDALAEQVDLSQEVPTIILGTGQEQENLRTALWLKSQYPNVQIFTRTTASSNFALEVGQERGINTVSITELVQKNMPETWFR